MSVKTKRWIVWAPRILSIAFALFLSLFALDAFEPSRSVLEAIPVFIVHLWPAALIAAILLLAWRREWIGGVCFAILAALYLARTWGMVDWSVYAVIPLPLLVIAGLFLASWRVRRDSGGALAMADKSG